MSTDRSFIDKIVEKMYPLEIVARPMFGEYGLYFEGKNFAFVCDNTLFVKVTDAGARVAGRIAKGPPYPGAKPAFKVSPAKMNDHDWLIDLVIETSGALTIPKPRKKARP